MQRIWRIMRNFLNRLIPRYLKSLFLTVHVGRFNDLSEGEKYFFELIASDVTGIVDVGARTDTYYSNHESRENSGRKIFLVEANPAFARKLKIFLATDDKSTVLNIAAGKESSELHYYYDTQSFVARSNMGNVSSFKSRHTIPVRPLDTIIDRSVNVDFLKTDIEEMDFYALLGATELLKNVKYIQFELGLGMPHMDRKVENRDYWNLLEPQFDLYLLKDANPIWRAFPNLPLLIKLSPSVKIMIPILQQLGYGFNIVGIRTQIKIPVGLADQIGEMEQAMDGV